MLQKMIETAVSEFVDPYLGKALGAVKALKSITVSDQQVVVELMLPYPHHTYKPVLQAALSSQLMPHLGGRALLVHTDFRSDTHVGKQGIQALPQIKNIIAVASGKGGVGKSTVAVNLALALAHEGAVVGLLDADIYGPSQPLMLGTQNQKPVIENKTIHPMRTHGIQSISIGNLVDPQTALAWRGPMLGKALEQLMYDTRWEALDYLVVDLPPGTGDVQLTLCQKMPVTGAVIVTTPQDMALHDVRRACDMFAKLSVPILGVVENMSYYHCPKCDHEEHLFGEGGGEKLAQEYHLAMLGAIPLDRRIREMTDHGHPPVVHEPTGVYAKAFSEVARKTAAKIALQPKDYSAKFPKIVVKD